jgi:hypothetical protein
MLLLALVGMGLSQATEKGAWGFWLVVVVIYAALGLWRSTEKAKRSSKPIGSLIGHQLAHWAVLLAFLAVLFLLERREIINRDSASDVALLILALSCCLAGVHFDPLLLIVGVVLTIMLVGMAMLEQYSIVLWGLMIVAVIAAAAFFYFKSKGDDASYEPFDSAAE